MRSQIKSDALPWHLVTTADERTWRFDRPVLFLGEWCRRYDRRHIWSTMDAIVAEPYGLREEDKDKDCAYVAKLSDELLVELRGVLNKYHKTDHSLRYWRIVLEHWLHRYVSVVFNRWATLQQGLRCYEVAESTVRDTTSYNLATTDSRSFILACNDDVWNYVLYSKILTHLDCIPLKPVGSLLDVVQGLTAGNQSSASKTERFKPLFKRAAGMLQVLSRDNDAVILNSYLPRNEEVKLQLVLGQVPQLWATPALETTNLDCRLRRQLTINASSYQGVDQFVRTMLMEVTPACYLEGYQKLNSQVQALSWPKNPRFIFTSNNFDTNEIFKVWTGLKVEQGVPYFVGQHGNHYGTSRHNTGITELTTSDRFMTWGWTDEGENCVPTFIFRTAGKKRLKINADGGLLLIETHVPHRIDPWDSYSEFHTYQDEQFRFVESLPDSIQQDLTVRLHGECPQLALSRQRWEDRNSNLRVESGVGYLTTLIRSSRLVVFSYDSTGMLETLSLNFPTLCFWHGGLSCLLPSARPYYERLMEAGILFDSPEIAAKKVSDVWGNVLMWWNSEEVQNARRNFCDRYARVVTKPAVHMANILTAYEKALVGRNRGCQEVR